MHEMDNFAKRRSSRWTRLFVWALVTWVGLACFASIPAAQAAEETQVSTTEPEQGNFFLDVLKNLFNSPELMKTLRQPRYEVFAFLALNVIVFTETGLLIGFCLPGDSLLVMAGVICFTAGWNLPLLLVTLCLSAIIGDSVGYTIGWKTGPKIFCRENSWLFHKDHLLKAQQFYEKHGGKTIILARFMPIIRTFAPVVAGVGRMDYRRFVCFNIFGGIGWVVSMILIGYALPTIINPPLQGIFGETFDVQNHIEKVIILVVLLSISPGIFLWLKHKFGNKQAPGSTIPIAARDKVVESTRSDIKTYVA
jgi:membrane-associated protein